MESMTQERSLSGAGDYSTMPVRPERRGSERRRRNPDSISKEGSVESSERRSRKNVRDTLKKFVSSKSVEDSSTGKTIAGVGRLPASVGIGSETQERRKRDGSLSSKIRNMFKKPSSRSASIDGDADKKGLDQKSTSSSPVISAASRRKRMEPQSSIESVNSTTSVSSFQSFQLIHSYQI